METKKSKIFGRKLIALFLSVLMALSCFTGALTAFAESDATAKDYHDNNLAANFMAWAETTDEQTAEALLDWADLHLADLMTSLLGSTHIYFKQSVVVATIKIDAYVDSVDGLFDLFQQADDLLDSYGNLVGGDIKNIDLNAVGDDLGTPSGDSISAAYGVVNKCAYRANYSAKELIMALAKVLYVNSNDVNGANVLNQFVLGTLSLGSILESVIGDDLYGLLQDTFGMWDDYEANIAYNIVANLMFENTKWFTDEEIATYKTDLQKVTTASNNTSSNRNSVVSSRTWDFNFDDVLFNVLNKELLSQIHINVTYSNMVEGSSGDYVNDSSKARYTRISEEAKTTDQTSQAFIKAAIKDAEDQGYTYNSNVVYFAEDTASDATTANLTKETGYVFLFQEMNIDTATNTGSINKSPVNLKKTDTLYSFAFNALKVAWDTILEDTLGIVHVNFNGHESDEKGTNFDNVFYYWVEANGGWDTDDWASNYSEAKVQAWAEDVYEEEYGCSSAEEFLANVKNTFDYDRNAKNDKKNWQDIDSTSLFNKLRYSPLADKYFNIQTGPINLYFEQTGIEDISTFFESAFSSYNNIVDAFNNALVAVTKVVFPNSSNIGYGTKTENDENKPAENLEVPTMAETEAKNASNADIASTLVSNVMKMFEYAANTTDANILAPFYTNNNISTLSDNLSETNAEEALLPLLISCLQNISATEQIHDEKWDSCKDAEGVAIVALEEYLSYVLPDKDYSILWTYDEKGYIVAASGINNDQNGDNTYDLFDAILIMARDAVSYWVQSIVPTRDNNYEEWDVYTSDVDDSTTIFDILNSVIVYYASFDGYGDKTTDSNSGVTINNTGKAVASLLGVVNSNGECLVSKTNDIWTNLDNIVNTLLPVVGTLQYGDSKYAGKASTYDLIWSDLVNGVLNIGEVRKSTTGKPEGVAATGKQGITNILLRLLTIVTSSPISSEGVDVMIYDELVVPTVNALFGARYSTQRYDKVIPYSSWYGGGEYGSSDTKISDGDTVDGYVDTKAESPFDALLTTSTLGLYSAINDEDDGKTTGVLGILIYNIYEIFGGNTTNDGTKGCWNGAMFAVEAVNNFIPSFVPQLSDHTFSATTATIADPSQSGKTGGSAFTATTLDITNNSMGLNRFYRDSNGNVQRDGRYYVDITNISISGKTATSDSASTSNITLGSKTGTVAPESTLSISVQGNAPTEATTYTFTITYNVRQAAGTASAEKTLYTGLTATAYMYITPDKDWQDTVYDGTSGDDKYISTYNISNKSTFSGDPGSNTTYTQATSTGGTSTRLWAVLPYDFIIPISETQGSNADDPAFTHNTFTMKNKHTSDVYFDGIYTYLNKGDQYYAVSGTTVSDTLTTATASDSTMAYAAIDPATGDLLNYDLYDYSIDNGKNWYRGDVNSSSTGTHAGYTSTEISKLTFTNDAGEVVSADKYEGFQTRTHVAFTFDEACEMGIVLGVNREQAADDEDGNPTYTYSAVYVRISSATTKYSNNVTYADMSTMLLQGNYGDTNSKLSITMGTPTPGLFLTSGKTAATKKSSSTTSTPASTYVRFLSYDGSTTLEAEDYNMAVHIFTTNNNNMDATIHMYIADDTEASTLESSYNTSLKAAATYREADFTDYKNGTSATYQSLQSALTSAVQAISTPVNSSNATSLGSKTETIAATETVTDSLHKDIAYAPISTSTTLDSQIQAYAVKGSDNYWYWDEDQNIPIYSSAKLKEADTKTINGKTCDATGAEVALGEDGYYHLVNTPVYKTDWDTETYDAPYLMSTSEQETNSEGKLLYSQITFVYRDADGNKVTSTDENWKYKIAEKTTHIIPNTTTNSENRSLYQQCIDRITYYYQILQEKVDTSIANYIGAAVSVDRENQTNVNYNVASYEKMVKIAKEAEKLIDTETTTVVKNGYVMQSVTAQYPTGGNSLTEIQAEKYAIGDDTIVVEYDEEAAEISGNDSVYKGSDGNYYTASEVETIPTDYTTTKSSLEIQLALAMYEEFKSYAQPRGYIGDKLEAEITCATTPGYTSDAVGETLESLVTKDQLSASVTRDANDEVTDAAVTTTVSEVEYGAVENGTIVNTGAKVYTADSWDAYIKALAVAVETVTDADDKLSQVYTAKTNLQKAENNLEEIEAEDDNGTITVSGTIMIATDETGTDGEFGLVGINITTEDGTVVATSAKDGTFEAVVPAGTTSLVISGDTTIDRTVTLSGTADISGVTIGVVMCDYNDKDGAVNTTDAGLFTGYLSNYYVYADFNNDGAVNTTDAGLFNVFIGKTIVYTDLALD